MSTELGFCEGDTCGRNGCAGVIAMHRSDNCSCHINPPCSSCTAPRNFCPECDWQEADDPAPKPPPLTKAQENYWAEWRAEQERIRNRPLDNTKVDWRSKSHTHFSMIKEGVYQEGMTMDAVRKEVDGTFGGRFEQFGGGKFKFIAYTD